MKTTQLDNAYEWAMAQGDDAPDADEMAAMFAVVYGREPDQHDRDDGLYSLICAGLEAEGYDVRID